MAGFVASSVGLSPVIALKHVLLPDPGNPIIAIFI
jgi:hypothetical protein